jgi:hypothetical protein
MVGLRRLESEGRAAAAAARVTAKTKVDGVITNTTQNPYLYVSQFPDPLPSFFSTLQDDAS